MRLVWRWIQLSIGSPVLAVRMAYHLVMVYWYGLCMQFWAFVKYGFDAEARREHLEYCRSLVAVRVNWKAHRQ